MNSIIHPEALSSVISRAFELLGKHRDDPEITAFLEGYEQSTTAPLRIDGHPWYVVGDELWDDRMYEEEPPVVIARFTSEASLFDKILAQSAPELREISEGIIKGIESLLTQRDALKFKELCERNTRIVRENNP